MKSPLYLVITVLTLITSNLAQLGAAELNSDADHKNAPSNFAKKDFSRSPNIILIMADDLGYESLGANGGESYKTPNLDRLARLGTRFEHCYAQPLCTPSRVKLMTGKSNIRNYESIHTLHRNESTFAQLLQKNGYLTCIAGKWHLGSEIDSPQHFGFQEALLWRHTREGRLEDGKNSIDKRYQNPMLEKNGVEVDFNNGEFGPDLMTNFICDFITKNKEQPFLVYYPMVLSHWPFVPTPDSEDWNPKDQGSQSRKGNSKYFADMVSYADKLVGRIVDRIEVEGLTNDTIIIFTADNGNDELIVSVRNGREVRGDKAHMTDAGTRVPLLAYCPGRVAAQECSELVDLSDFLPTLCDATKTKIPENIDGQSFFPLLKMEEAPRRDWIYMWYSRNARSENARIFARSHRYKLYATGEFFDLKSDVLEEKPLPVHSLTNEQQAVREKLQLVILNKAKLDKR